MNSVMHPSKPPPPQDTRVHVMPRFGRKHVSSLDCWCMVDGPDPDSTEDVIVHNIEH